MSTNAQVKTSEGVASQQKPAYYKVNKSFMAYGEHFPTGSVFSTEFLYVTRKNKQGNYQQKYDPDGIVKELSNQDVKVRKEQYHDAIGSVTMGGNADAMLTERQKQRILNGEEVQIPIPTKTVKRIEPISYEEYESNLANSTYGAQGRRHAEMEEFV